MAAIMGRSSDTLLVPYERIPGLPAVSVGRWHDRDTAAASRIPPAHAHAHDFLVLVHVVRGEAPVRVDDRDWTLATGDAFVIAPGSVVIPGHPDERGADVWAVYFPADAVDPQGPGSLVSWRAHPLLAPFTRGGGQGGQRFPVPAADRPTWLAHLTAMEDELEARRDGYAAAVHAHLTLLLVGLARLGADVADDLRLRDEPMLAAVFDVIESRFHEPVSLADVAAAVGMSPGHLTTVVGERTGRTVLQWLTERRMTEARRLLAGTDLTVAELASRVGYRDAGWFIKRFRAAHGVTPLEWRRAGR